MSVKFVNIFSWLLQAPGDSGGSKHFSEVVEAPEFLSSLYIFLNDFYKTSGVPGGPKHFSEVVKAPECLSIL